MDKLIQKLNTERIKKASEHIAANINFMCEHITANSTECNINSPKFNYNKSYEMYKEWRLQNQDLLYTIWNISSWPKITKYDVEIWASLCKEKEQAESLLNIWILSNKIRYYPHQDNYCAKKGKHDKRTCPKTHRS